MNQGKYVFAQLMEFVPKYEFNKCVNRYNGNYRVQSFSCWQQFLCMAFGHLTFRESLRDIVVCLEAQNKRLYHLGFRSKIARSTFSDVNNNRDWRIYHDFAHYLMDYTCKLYFDESNNRDFSFPVYALDSTLIRLCLSMFFWAKYRKTTAGLKLHTLLDVETSIPRYIHITDGKVGDITVLKKLVFERNALYVMDRGYLSLEQLNRIDKSNAYFVIRVKKTINFKRRSSADISGMENILMDHYGVFRNPGSRKLYPDKLRCIKVKDPDMKKPIWLLTNHLEITAEEVADIYRSRWKVELFFKWIKQHLRIKALWGRNENAVKTQIYAAIASYLIIAIMRKQLNIELNMYQILQILSISMTDKTPVNQLFTKSVLDDSNLQNHNQLSMWDL